VKVTLLICVVAMVPDSVKNDTLLQIKAFLESVIEKEI